MVVAALSYLASFVDGFLALPAVHVRARVSVAKLVDLVRQHGVENTRVDGRRGLKVQVHALARAAAFNVYVGH